MSGTNNQILFCKNCVISNQRPSSVVEFKNKTEDIKPMIELREGICSACLWEDKKKKIDWGKRKKELTFTHIFYVPRRQVQGYNY